MSGERAPLIAEPTHNVGSVVGSYIQQVMGVIEASFPDYSFTWVQNSNPSIIEGHMERGSFWCLLCCGAFAQCFCMHAKWEVYIVSSNSRVYVALGKSDNSILLTCLLGGAIGASLTASEYNRVRGVLGAAVYACSQQQGFEYVDQSPPSYDAISSQPPPAYREAINQGKQLE